MRTRVGYSGGAKENPTYRSLGDHAETIEIDFDPKRVTYNQLLEVFFRAHNPMRRSWSRQYMSAIFYHDDEQLRLALEAKQRYARQEGGKVYTEVLPFEAFYLAENYHQKHSLQRYPDFFNEIRILYPTVQGLVGSTAVARLNGYLGGYGRYEDLKEEIDGYGLAPEARDRLLEIVRDKGW